MALVNNKSECALCGKTINTHHKYIAFPAFVGNTIDPLFILNDAIVHEKCFESFAYYKEMQKIQEIMDSVRKRGYTCMVCKEQIINPDELISFGYITYDQEDPLFELNYKFVHKTCIHNREVFFEYIDRLQQLRDVKKWVGTGIQYLIDELQNACNDSHNNITEQAITISTAHSTPRL